MTRFIYKTESSFNMFFPKFRGQESKVGSDL